MAKVKQKLPTDEERADFKPVEFTIDPATREFKDLRSVCDAGSPYRCLIATAASIHIGRRVTVRVDHEGGTGVIGITVGKFRYERPMTEKELDFASKFDAGSNIKTPLTVRIDLTDPAWLAKPKAYRGSSGRKDGTRPRWTIRARQLEIIRRNYEEQEGKS